MAHIKDLHVNILQKVFAYFHGRLMLYSPSLNEFMQLLPPAAVCRAWRECMLPYVYHTAYLDYHIKETNEGSKTKQVKCKWKSNIDLIVSQRLSSATRELRVKSFCCSVSPSYIHRALDAFGFNSTHWRAVNVLVIKMVFERDIARYSTGGYIGSETSATQFTEYFGQHLPHISDLSIDYFLLSYIPSDIWPRLVNLYASQLHALICSATPITFDCRSFSPRLRHLHVSIGSGVSNRLPQLPASPLEKLELFDIPHNFAWWTFIGTTPGFIEFTNLRELRLEFRHPPGKAVEQSNSTRQVQASKASFNIGCCKLFFPKPKESNRQVNTSAPSSKESNRQVRTSTVSLDIGCYKMLFPKLKQLIIVNSPYNDGEFYSMFAHSPLQHVEIRGSFKSVHHVYPRNLFNAANVRFGIQRIAPDDYKNYPDFYHRLLGTPSNARTATLHTYNNRVPLPIPSKIEWINLVHLYLYADIHFASVIQVVIQMPKLRTLIVGCVVDKINEAGSTLQAILEDKLTQTPSISTTLKSISIYLWFDSSRVFSLDVTCYLTILVHSLVKVAVPSMYVSDIEEFAAHHANAFPHLRNIEVRGSTPWYD